MKRHPLSKALARLSALTLQRAEKGRLPPACCMTAVASISGSTTSSAAWLYRYQQDHGQHWMGLGRLADMPAPGAREIVRQHRLARAQGRDPLIERRIEERQRDVQRVTFKAFADPILDQLDRQQLNAKHRANWRQSIVDYAYPVIGRLTLDEIDTRRILKILEPIWGPKHPTAKRVRQRLEPRAVIAGARSSAPRTRWRDLRAR